jgi:subtilase family serine protease
MMTALAPNAKQILVYDDQAASFESNLYMIYSQIASDDSASVVSSSWYSYPMPSDSQRQAENDVFMQMAGQGQSFFVASGDAGAYPYGTSSPNFAVEDPADQPYVTAVGGTELTDTTIYGYSSESAWGTDTGNGTGGGGGYNAFWPLPDYQMNSFATAPTGVCYSSYLYRNVPDVSLFADYGEPNQLGWEGGYETYWGGNWHGQGGTSAAAPLWAAFAALVNQRRAAEGWPALGFANYGLYADAENPVTYATDFHDITSGNNLAFPAVTGYDDATGWGSFNGANLLADLAGSPSLVWSPVAFSVGPDGYTHVLWDASNGRVAIWTLDTGDNLLSTAVYGPNPGWSGTGIAVGSDNIIRVLLTNTTSGTFTYWTDSGGALTFHNIFSPGSGWNATGIAAGTSGQTSFLLTSTGGQMVYWNGSGNTFTPSSTYGPFAGWSAVSIGVGPDGYTHVLWNETGAYAQIWTFDASMNLVSSPTYGPNPGGWTAQSLAVGSDNVIRILVTNTDLDVTYWLDSGGTFTFNDTWACSPWSTIGISAGPSGQTSFLFSDSPGYMNFATGSGSTFTNSAVFNPF